MKRKVVLSLFFILAMLKPVFASNDNLLVPNKVNNVENKINSGYFSLANIMDVFLSAEAKKDDVSSDDKSKVRKQFVSITSKFNQGNAKVAYGEYLSLIDSIKNDTSLLALSKVFYEIGFFSLGDKAIEKIVYENQFSNNISDLKISYKPKALLSQEEEIYFAKAYSNIYFNNNADEVVSELHLKRNKYSKNDFYNYLLSCAYLESKQYGLALNSINKAISINPENINYRIFKIDTLIKMKKYKEAKKIIEKIEKSKNILALKSKVDIQRQIIMSFLSTDVQEKKYYSENKSFLEGNYEKTRKDCKSILNFDKENSKIAALLAKSELALLNFEQANIYFVNAYKIDKKNIEALIGLGDIRYLHGDYKNAVKIYKKAYNKNKNNYEALIKLFYAQKQYARNPKEIKKLEVLLDKMPKKEFAAYYNCAISMAQKNNVLKEEFLKKAISANPLFANAVGELIELQLKNKNHKIAKSLIYNISFTLEKNYYYYYLCGLYSQSLGKTKEAIQFYKTSLNLNPNFEIANIKLLKLIPSASSEEI